MQKTIIKAKDKMTIKVFIQGIWKNLKVKRRFQLILLLILMLSTALLEVLSLASAIPFLTLLNNKDKVLQQPLIRRISEFTNIYETNDIVILLSLLFILATIIAMILRIVNVYYNTKIAALIGTDLSSKCYRKALSQSYIMHSVKSSGELIDAISIKVPQTIGGITALLQLTTFSLVAIGIIFSLFIFNWQVALFTSIIFINSYYIISVKTRNRLRVNSKIIAQSSTNQVKSIQLGIGAIREVILSNLQNKLVDKFESTDKKMRSKEAQNIFLTLFPKYSLEGIGLSAIAMMAMYLIIINKSSNIIATLGIVALACQKLLPALQQVYASIAKTRSYQSSLFVILEILELPTEIYYHDDLNKSKKFNKSIELKNVSFKYSDNYILDNLNLNVNKGECIGVIGESGSGKSTTIDILMSLLKPNRGLLLIDNKNIYDKNHPERIIQWRNTIAHIPQSIYITEGTICENIAFGVSQKRVNMDLIVEVSKIAQIHSLVESLPNRYNQHVGERGIRLSGGQRQRIGIARALYRKADVLFLDEATSALDNITENRFMDCLYELKSQGDLTIFIVAHRLTTLKSCDRIIELKNGFIENIYSPKDIL